MDEQELRWEYIGRFFEEFGKKPTLKELENYMEKN